MPTNLPPECIELEKKYLEARGTSEKIEALQKYLASIPKHKGTERLCARLKTKLAKLRLEAAKKKRKSSSYLGRRYTVKKEGAAQVVLMGFTGSGKSSLLKALTSAKPEVHEYPFTTREPIPGMMVFEDIQIQLVEAPALFEGAVDGSDWGSRILGLARNADGLILVIDLSAPDPALQLEMLIKELDKGRIAIVERRGDVEIERREVGGIQVVAFGELKVKIHDVKQLLRSMKIDNALVRIKGDVDIVDVSQALLRETLYKPALVIANKMDVEGADEKLRRLRGVFSNLDIVGASTVSGRGVKEIPTRVFKCLKIIRVYTKKPRLPPSDKPMILKEGATVGDIARLIHKDLYSGFKYARLWGSSKYPGERVGLSYVLRDRDVLEIRA